jgi:hypothetical protein
MLKDKKRTVKQNHIEIYKDNLMKQIKRKSRWFHLNRKKKEHNKIYKSWGPPHRGSPIEIYKDNLMKQIKWKSRWFHLNWKKKEHNKIYKSWGPPHRGSPVSSTKKGKNKLWSWHSNKIAILNRSHRSGHTTLGCSPGWLGQGITGKKTKNKKEGWGAPCRQLV